MKAKDFLAIKAIITLSDMAVINEERMNTIKEFVKNATNEGSWLDDYFLEFSNDSVLSTFFDIKTWKTTLNLLDRTFPVITKKHNVRVFRVAKDYELEFMCRLSFRELKIALGLIDKLMLGED